MRPAVFAPHRCGALFLVIIIWLEFLEESLTTRTRHRLVHHGCGSSIGRLASIFHDLEITFQIPSIVRVIGSPPTVDQLLANNLAFKRLFLFT